EDHAAARHQPDGNGPQTWRGCSGVFGGWFSYCGRKRHAGPVEEILAIASANDRRARPKQDRDPTQPRSHKSSSRRRPGSTAANARGADGEVPGIAGTTGEGLTELGRALMK